MNPLLARLPRDPLGQLKDQVRALRERGDRHWDFSMGDPHEPTPQAVRQALVDAVEATSQYPSPFGSAALRRTIAAWVQRRFGVEVDPETQVLPTAGSKEAIFHLPLAVADPHSDRRATIWGAPGYQSYERGALFAGGESDPVALTHDAGWRLELDSLEPERLRRAAVAWLCYPHNPTGAIVDRDFLRRSLATAREHGIVLCSDECYCDIYPIRAEPPPSLLQAADGNLRGLLVAFSLSKRSGMTGYRSGALIGDPELIAAQRLLRPNLGTASQDFVQAAAIAAWSDDEHVAERRAAFAAKREVLLPFLTEAGMTVSGSEATFYLWVAAPGGDDAAYAEALLQHQVIISPGRSFGPAGTGWLRLALVPDVEECRQAVEAWREAIATGSLPGH